MSDYGYETVKFVLYLEVWVAMRQLVLYIKVWETMDMSVLYLEV